MKYILKGIELYVKTVIVVFGVISLIVLAPIALLGTLDS